MYPGTLDGSDWLPWVELADSVRLVLRGVAIVDVCVAGMGPMYCSESCISK